MPKRFGTFKPALAGLFAIVFFGSASATPVAAGPLDPGALGDLHWRSIGPYRGGWSTTIAGVPRLANTFYFGAAGGGVWKTTDAGHSWHSIFDQQPAASIGAIAVSNSAPGTLYVGTGQPQARYDVAAGNGVYKSVDAGKSWTHIGLAASKHIGAILIDPKNADIALVAALGPYFAASKDRGVYRTADGGKTWQQTLFVDADTGVVDLAVDPTDSNIVFAASWTARNYPWMSYFTPVAGPGSAIYKSVDGGKSFTKLSNFPSAGAASADNGWLGRIGLAVTHTAKGTRVYAVVDHPKSGGLYRSDDAGANWQVVQADPGLTTRYFARISTSLSHPDTVYVMGRSMKVSTNGGKTMSFLRGSPGGDDYHQLWIDPNNPQIMAAASDQGSTITLDGGQGWSNWYNQPTGQMYHLAVDDRFPYWIYAGQQDNGSVAITSRSDYGAISFRDWHPVGADERDDDLPDPTDPNIVFGSGLGGRVSRYDHRTGDVQNVSPSVINTYGQDPRKIAHRWSWITPMEFSKQPPYALYLGAQVLFRSLDRGATWSEISPDLTRLRTADSKNCADQPYHSGQTQADKTLNLKDARDCGFGVIFSIAPSPTRNNDIWVGTDSGLVQRTTDGGKTWRNVTPKQLPQWGTVSRIDLSNDANTAYIAVDLHRLDQFRPMILKTHDGGNTWVDISAGLPNDQLTSVVRVDPQTPGLLFVGNEHSVFVSIDDGAHWQSLSQDLPTAWVRDLLIKNDDLVIATQGRAIWIMDNITRLRQLATRTQAGAENLKNTLFEPALAYRLRKNQNRDTPLPPDMPVGENPPTGAIIEYLLAPGAKRVQIDILDNAGALVRTFASDAAPEKLEAEQYFSNLYVHVPTQPATTAGAHRFLWDLRYPRPQATSYEYSIAAVHGQSTELLPLGALALPGKYTVRLNVDGEVIEQSLRVKLDPRLSLSSEELAQIFNESQRVSRAIGRSSELAAKIKLMVTNLAANAAENAERLSALTSLQTDSPGAMSADSIATALAAVSTDIDGAERAPVVAQTAFIDAMEVRLTELEGRFDKLREGAQVVTR